MPPGPHLQTLASVMNINLLSTTPPNNHNLTHSLSCKIVYSILKTCLVTSHANKWCFLDGTRSLSNQGYTQLNNHPVRSGVFHCCRKLWWSGMTIRQNVKGWRCFYICVFPHKAGYKKYRLGGMEQLLSTMLKLVVFSCKFHTKHGKILFSLILYLSRSCSHNISLNEFTLKEGWSIAISSHYVDS